MPKFKTHIIGGVVSGIIALYMLKEFAVFTPDIYSTLFALIFSIIGSVLPDKIEPAKNSHHRSLFHSKIALVIAGSITYYILFIGNFNITGEPVIEYFIGFFCIGYISHLILDATTPAGLPLFY
ncbi:MAG: metal-dependent hydrolase [Methanohalobium sp.]|uniref:metal-dependent hydrolase n=1 Tax=Methanohalobium sp. TaxID=2837493 RepID=UPI00397E5AEA